MIVLLQFLILAKSEQVMLLYRQFDRRQSDRCQSDRRQSDHRRSGLHLSDHRRSLHW